MLWYSWLLRAGPEERVSRLRVPRRLINQHAPLRAMWASRQKRGRAGTSW